ncbi:MAG: hypothetical protein UX39_C0009G0012 [Candidatus Magasanikbacteria bacterium GW2011_GWA2_46_17]|uniref:Uncharacterized protein n=1 Tax=Candidatus Magasanikbacteria bacterium GW2011_GWA2_46_17 TaxID=1619042 RepID=A0A0G1P0I1_9BACT|nr:MAG: hypothetical protein UX39_C0009G0012 [Candidatus Magasanikbacteria bacterium GW2011_GWA2_46_17]
MENVKVKMENYGIRYADNLSSAGSIVRALIGEAVEPK